MKRIDEARLENDLAYRFSYVSEFMGFAPEDTEAIHGAAEHLGPRVPGLVDAVYDKLLWLPNDLIVRHYHDAGIPVA